MSEDNLGSTFSEAIQLEPDNDLHRLIYADWLEERGFPEADRQRRIVAGDLSAITNSYGNVNVHGGQKIPHHFCRVTTERGSTVSAISRLCNKLGIAYAQAFCGFGRHRGKHYPEFDGIVVARKDVAAIQEAIADWESRDRYRFDGEKSPKKNGVSGN